MKWILVGVLLLVLGALAVETWFGSRHRADLQRRLDQQFETQQQAAEQAVAGKLTGLKSQEQRLQRAIQETRRLQQELGAKLKKIDQEIDRQAVERKRLIETGTIDETLEAGRRLGYHPVEVPRPR